MEEGRIVGDAGRAGLWAAQTPQVFRADACARRTTTPATRRLATDDATLVEDQGGIVLVEAVAGPNLKVTTPRTCRRQISTPGRLEPRPAPE